MNDTLPWQDALIALKSMKGEVLDGAWSWRKIVLDGTDMVDRLLRLQLALSRTGEEWSVTVYRPQAREDGTGGPAIYLIAIVTWGPYLDHTTEEIFDQMNATYGEGRDGTVGGKSEGEGAGRLAALPSGAGGARGT